MSDLPTVKVSECCDILDNLRIPLNAEEREKIKGNIPYCGANGIQGYISEYIFDEDLILLAEDGGNFDEYQTRPIAYRISGKSWVNNHAHVLRAKEGYDFSFVFYSLQHKNIIPFIKGGTRAKLNQAELREITIWDAPLPIQQRIGEIIETIDNQIDATQALIDKYTAIKQGMMADLFSRGIDPETKALRPTFEEAPELYHETPLGMLPKGWETKSLDSVVESLVDGPFGSNLKSEHYVDSSPYRVVRLQNIVEYQYNDENKAFIPAEHFEFLKRNTVFPGDVLIAGLGEERYPVGRSCCYPADFPPAVNKADCFRARGINGVLENTYLMLFLNSEVARHQIRRLEQGVTRPRVNTGNLKKIIVCLPSIEEQNLATEKYQSIQNVVGGLEAELKKLTSQKAGLMQDLLSGKVPVPA